MRVWQMQDDRFDAECEFKYRICQDFVAIFAGTAGTKVITKPDVAHQAPLYLQPLPALVPKAS
jgi:hypothetical protein